VFSVFRGCSRCEDGTRRRIRLREPARQEGGELECGSFLTVLFSKASLQALTKGLGVLLYGFGFRSFVLGVVCAGKMEFAEG